VVLRSARLLRHRDSASLVFEGLRVPWRSGLDIQSSETNCGQSGRGTISCCVVEAHTRLAQRNAPRASFVARVACEIVARLSREKFPKSESHNYLTGHPTSRCECFSAKAMAIQKKHGKGRLDKWYKLAKEKGIYLTQICAITR
jgi:hypothetical protein